MAIWTKNPYFWPPRKKNVDFFIFWPNFGIFVKKIRIFPFFWTKIPKFRQKTEKSKKWMQHSFCTIFVYNLAKFHVSSTFGSLVISKNVILRYHDFSENKGFSLILTQFWSYIAQWNFFTDTWSKTQDYMRKHIKTCQND